MKADWPEGKEQYFDHVLYLFQIYPPLMLTYVSKKRRNTHCLGKI